MFRILLAFSILSSCLALAQTETEQETPETVVRNYFNTFNAYEFQNLRNYIHPKFASGMKDKTIEMFEKGQTEGLPPFEPAILPLISAYDVLLEVELYPFMELGFLLPLEVDILENHFVNNDTVVVKNSFSL